MLCLVGLADHCRRGRRQVMLVGGGRVVLERLVVRDVVRYRGAGNVLVARVADGLAGGRGAGGRKATLEPAPADALVVEQIAHVPPAHQHLRAGGWGAVIQYRAWVADDGAVRDVAWHGGGGGAMGLAGNEIERARRRGTELCVEGVVA